jgi:hypothetical protein
MCPKQLRDAFSFVRVFYCEQAHAFATAVRSCMFPDFLQVEKNTKLYILPLFVMLKITVLENSMKNFHPQEYLKRSLGISFSPARIIF